MKTILITAPLLIILLLGMAKTFSQPLRIVRNDNQRKLPLKRSFAGIRSVMKLRRSVLLIVGSHQILLPAGTIVDDEYQPGKIIFPEGYSCTLTMDGQTIKTPPGGAILLCDTHLTSVQVDPATPMLKVGSQAIPFSNAMGGQGVSFFEQEKVQCGYLREDTRLQVGDASVWFHNHEGMNSDVWDHKSYEFGNIVFYPSGAVHKGYLRDTTVLKAGQSAFTWLPGKMEFYENGSVKKGITAQMLTGTTAGAQFTILPGEEVTLNQAGAPIIPEEIVSLHQVTIPVFPGTPFYHAKVRYYKDSILIQEGELKNLTWFSLPAAYPDGTLEKRNIPFGPGNEDRNIVSFYYQTFMPVYGYAGQDFSITIRKQTFTIQAGTLMRFYISGVLEEATLGQETVVVIDHKKYLLARGASMKWYKNGEINPDVLLYTNKSANKVRALE